MSVSVKDERLLVRGRIYPIAACFQHRVVARATGTGEPRAIWTGERRPPRKGEWYLSGAVIGAYRAPGHLRTAYDIAEIVRVRVVSTVEVIGPWDFSSEA
jgi:hypothetical protein